MVMNQSNCCIYEDRGYADFGPLTQTRAVWDLRCGAFTIAEKIGLMVGRINTHYHLRGELKPLYLENGFQAADLNPIADGGDWLFLNGRVLFTDEAVSRIFSADKDTVFTSGGAIVAFRLSGQNLELVNVSSGRPVEYSGLNNLVKQEIGVQVLDYPWQLVDASADQIKADLRLAEAVDPGGSFKGEGFVRVSILDNVRVTGRVEVRPGVMVDADSNRVRLEDGVRLGVGVAIDAAEGPVWLAENASIEAGAILTGPVYIGTGSIVRAGARLSDGVCLGPQCRVGGEVSRTVFQGYSNKQHSGYLGRSFVGGWVNLGAATDNSDLKNNYRPIVVTVNGREINTGGLHVGAFIGDFSRTAIHTRLNSGTIIGVCCNIFGNDFPVREIPAFVWYGSDGWREYRLDKALETIGLMMPRRNRELTPALETLLRGIFDSSKAERERIDAR